MNMSIESSDDAIERLCKLQARVQEHLGYDHAADCFCGKGGFWNSSDYDGSFENGYRNDGVAIEFIEKAVLAALEGGE